MVGVKEGVMGSVRMVVVVLVVKLIISYVDSIGRGGF